MYDARLADTNNTVAGRKYTANFLFPLKYSFKVPMKVFGEDNRYALSASIREDSAKGSLIWVTTTATFIHPRKILYDLSLTRVSQ